MITKFQIYESINEGEPKIGNYVIVKPIKFLKSIGIISDIKYDEYGLNQFIYCVYFYNNNQLYKRFLKHEIKYWSKNKKDLEIILSKNKYNL